MIPGYFQTNYWADNYWSDYGLVLPAIGKITATITLSAPNADFTLMSPKGEIILTTPDATINLQ